MVEVQARKDGEIMPYRFSLCSDAGVALNVARRWLFEGTRTGRIVRVEVLDHQTHRLIYGLDNK